MSSYTRKTPAEKKKELDELTKKLNASIDEFIYDQEKLIEFVLFSSKFRDYSFRNRTIIYSQDPDALFIGSYKKWQELGHPVQKGERAIRIFAPIFVEYYKDRNNVEKRLYKNDTKAKEEIKKFNLETYRKTYFKLVPVFSNNQVQIEIEDYPKLLNEILLLEAEQDTLLIYQGLMNYADKNNINIKLSNLSGVVGGFYNHRTKDITIRNDVDNLAKVNILAHELAHAMLHDKDQGYLINEDYDLTKKIKEVQAQSVATLITSYYLDDFSEVQISYIKDWADKMSADERYRYIEEITDTTLEMIEEIDNTIVREKEEVLTKVIDGADDYEMEL